MSDIIIYILTTVGSIFIFMASLGIIRMPDFYLRLSVTIKASTFGIGFVLFAVAIYFNEFSVTTKGLAILFFLIVTAPVSGHLIGKTAFHLGIKLWDKSIVNDLEQKSLVEETPLSEMYRIEKNREGEDDDEDKDK